MWKCFERLSKILLFGPRYLFSTDARGTKIGVIERKSKPLDLDLILKIGLKFPDLVIALCVSVRKMSMKNNHLPTYGVKMAIGGFFRFPNIFPNLLAENYKSCFLALFPTTLDESFYFSET